MTSTPALLPNLAPGEVFVDTLMDENERLYCLILLPGEAKRADFGAQIRWAKSLGGALPNLLELRVLFEQAGSSFGSYAYWSCEVRKAQPFCAWVQYFDDGVQGHTSKFNEFHARAVRRHYL